MKNNSSMSVLLKGLLKENPVFVLILGTCPTLAVTTNVVGAFGMGIAALAVLVCSNILISLLRMIIPDSVRIPCYIVVIAGFVTIVQMLVQAFFPALYDMLGVYLPLIILISKSATGCPKIISRKSRNNTPAPLLRNGYLPTKLFGKSKTILTSWKSANACLPKSSTLE